MLLANIEDVLKLTRSDIRIDNPSDNDTNEFTFFNTDKFIENLNNMDRNAVITPDILKNIFENSITKGHINYDID